MVRVLAGYQLEPAADGGKNDGRHVPAAGSGIKGDEGIPRFKADGGSTQTLDPVGKGADKGGHPGADDIRAVLTAPGMATGAQAQAARLKENFLRDPSHVYATVVASLFI